MDGAPKPPPPRPVTFTRPKSNLLPRIVARLPGADRERCGGWRPRSRARKTEAT